MQAVSPARSRPHEAPAAMCLNGSEEKLPRQSRVRRSRSLGFPRLFAAQLLPVVADLRPFAAPCEVCGKMAPFRCKGCQAAFYCSRVCQRSHWHALHARTCRKPEGKVYQYLPPRPAGIRTGGTGGGGSLAAEAAVGSEVAANLASAAAAALESDSCGICLVEYHRGFAAEPGRLARRLPCGHVYCGSCLSRVIEYGSLRCPTCFRSHAVHDAGELPEHNLGDDAEALAAQESADRASAGKRSALEPVTEEDSGASDLASPSSVTSGGGGPAGGVAGGAGETDHGAPGSESLRLMSDPEALQSLVEMGFDASSAEAALAAAAGNVATAVGYLFDPSTMPEPGSGGGRAHGPPTRSAALANAPKRGRAATDLDYEADDDGNGGLDGDEDDGGHHRSARFAARVGRDNMTDGRSTSSASSVTTAAGPSLTSSSLAAAAAGVAASSSGWSSSDLLALVDMGFGRTEAQAALRACRYRFVEALAILTGERVWPACAVGDKVECKDDSDLEWKVGTVTAATVDGTLGPKVRLSGVCRSRANMDGESILQVLFLVGLTCMCNRLSLRAISPPQVLVDGTSSAFHWDRVRLIATATPGAASAARPLGPSATPNPMHTDYASVD